MADNTPTKRPHYFKSQFLVLRDFEDEQTYHEEMLRLHNSGLHSWGVVKDGLQVVNGATGIGISPGLAIDSLGREIVVEQGGEMFFLKSNGDQLKMTWNDSTSSFEVSLADAQAAATATGSKTDVYFTITFQEVPSDDTEDKYPPTGQQIDVTRYKQAPLITVEASQPTDGSSITLARVSLDAEGKISTTYNSARTLAGCIGPLSFTSGSPDNGKALADNMPQFGINYDVMADALTIKARSHSAPGLDATHLTIKRDTGYVGIGTPTPNAKLQINGGADTSLIIGDRGTTAGSVGLQFLGTHYRHAGLRFDGDNVIVENASNSYLPSSWYWDAQPMNFIVRNGTVGIGTESPKAKLDIADTTQNTMKSILGRLEEGNTTGIGTLLGVRAYTTQGTGNPSFVLQHHFYGNLNGWIAFCRGDSSDDGFVMLKSGWRTEGSDLAELFETAEQILPGDVVVFDEQEEVVKLCEREADSCVIGIASSEPAGVLGNNDGTAAPIALCGRVPCNVDADIAPILSGDLLTTSSTKGHAQKVLDEKRAAGAIIGKALGSLAKGKGKITVLVTLA